MSYTRLLKYTNPMMEGGDIREIQQKLNELNYNAGIVDGLFGENTKNAVLKFQQDNGLAEDGIVGINTWNKLFEGVIDELISNPLAEFVKSYEGFSSTPYYDCVGVRTIGYGSTHGWIMEKSCVTEEEATQALMEEINSMAKQIKNDLNSKGVILSQQQFDSLCSFSYNCGISGLFSSTLYKRICEGVRDSSLKENFEAWCHGNGQVIQGLLNRRREEYDIFMHGDYRRNL